MTKRKLGFEFLQPDKKTLLNYLIKIVEQHYVGVTGFEPATTRPPDVYSNRTELRPDSATEAVSSGLGLQI